MTPERIQQIILEARSLGMLQSEVEARDFALFCSERDVRHILEIGTRFGGSMYLLDRACGPGVRITIDVPWSKRDGNYQLHETRFRLKLPHVTQIIGDSHDAETFKAVDGALSEYTKTHDPDLQVLRSALPFDFAASQRVDLVFVDGDHSAAGSMQDYLDYSIFLWPGSLFAFHDVRNGFGCGQTYNELCGQYEHHEFCDPNPAHRCGIGCLIIP